MPSDMTPDKAADEAVDRDVEVRKIPKADRLLQAAAATGLGARLGHARVMQAGRAALAELRVRVLAGAACPPPPEIEAALLARLRESAKGSLRRVVNATGAVVHTDLGRATPPGEAPAPARAGG